MKLTLSCLLAAAGTAAANQYDVIYPNYIAPKECTQGCATWSDIGASTKIDQAKVNALFANGTVPPTASSHCAWPGMAPVHGEGRRMLGDAADDWMWHSSAAETSIPFCICKGTGDSTAPPGAVTAQCTPPLGTPEQINLQYAAADIVVAGFVTYEKAFPSEPPVAMLGKKGAAPKQLTGTAHWFARKATSRGNTQNYTMSFVKFEGLEPGTYYTYKVKSGAPGAKWSDEFTFRSIRAAPETKLVMYGDMGVSPYNNMQNMLTDCQSGKIDVFAHMGDHCYNLITEDDRKGDAYMNAMQPLTATCPWIPIVGNHESSDIERYLDQTWGEAYANPLANSSSTATSALGHVITKGNLLGAAMHGTTPSGTSDYYSVDVGLLHIAALSTITPSGAELAWLNKDLAAANTNRAKVPWVMVTSHYQIYLSGASQEEQANASAAYYGGEHGEFSPDPRAAFKTCAAAGEPEGCRTVADQLKEAASTLDPVFQKYGVDIYNAGHAHEYGVTWPMVRGAAVQKDYTNPKGTVYITEGNGGVPGVTSTHKFNTPKASWARIHGTGGAYGRFSFPNASAMQYEHVWNNGNNGTGQVMETWTITRSGAHPQSWPNPPTM